MADTIALGKLSPERQRYMLDGIRNQAMSINQQMSKLLDMAKLSAGKLELQTEWQPIDEVLGAALQLVKAQWKDREITVDLPPRLPPIRIDAVLIERVLWNLLENAIKYAPTDSPIEVTVRRNEQELELAVADAGPGLSEAQQENVFELFQRGRSESDIPGLGLGLAIARTIMAAHGGSITAHNRSGGGACFRLRFPLEQAPTLPDADAD
jgi:two-component system sensor histidine kinase KdpD